MKNDDTFSDIEAQSSSRLEPDATNDVRALSSSHDMQQDTSTSAILPRMERRLTSHRYMRLLLVALVVVILAALAGGYGVFRAVTQPSHQTFSAFQQTHCPFPLDAGLVDGKNVRCGFLSVPEDRSLPKSPTIHLAVAIFKIAQFSTCPRSCALSKRRSWRCSVGEPGSDVQRWESRLSCTEL